ncbi:eukaryotic translation initiation factor 4E-binding protein 3 [Trichosurus vulpecula]|uniref:eukaryotic translation initiation factor 4E-binding protein 3 n=1 Tax=Trichosurus vulpecula TaxID=9337 RepID=UPI00186B30ED|nr:eukaryotic translation initiation factor 4E-binding protein 3 [Trichosurus vulpecula]
MSTSTSCPIPGGRDRLPDCYSTTPGSTLYATTPGGTRISYNRKFLLECKNSPISLTPPGYLPEIPGVTGVTVPTQAPLAKLEELKEQKETEEIPDEAQFEMDI